MKRFGRGFLVYTTTGAVCLALSFTPSPAKGSKLLDLLRKKEVITEEEYRELKAVEEAEQARIEERIKKSQSPFDITYKDGFGVTSKDKTVELRVRVQLFNQFSVFPADSGADDNFFLRRARITFQGWVFRDFTYRLDLEGASSPLVRTTYLGWEKYKQFRIQVGQSITRFGGEEVWSRYSLFFLERSMISDNLTEGSLPRCLHL